MTQGTILAGRARDVRAAPWTDGYNSSDARELFSLRLEVGRELYFKQGGALLVVDGIGVLVFADLYGNNTERSVFVREGPVLFIVPNGISASIPDAYFGLHVFAVVPGKASIGDETQFRLDQQAMPSA